MAGGGSSSASNRKRKCSMDEDMDSFIDGPSSPSFRQSGGRSLAATPAKRLRLVWQYEEISRSPSPTPGASAPSGSSTATGALPSLTRSSSPSAQAQQVGSKRRFVDSSSDSDDDDSHEIVLPLNRILETLQKEDLLNIINGLVSQHPGLNAQVASLIPRPTVSSATAHLQQAQKRLESAYPYSRASGGQDRSSDYAFNRVRSHLTAVKELLNVYLTYFTQTAPIAPGSGTRGGSASAAGGTDHEYPVTAFGFLKVAGQVVASLSRWSSDAHHAQTRRLAWSWVANGWTVAVAEVARRVRHEGRMFVAAAVAEWYEDLVLARSTANEQDGMGGMFDEAVRTFEGSMGWLIGVGGSAFYQQQHQQQQQQHQHDHYHGQQHSGAHQSLGHLPHQLQHHAWDPAASGGIPTVSFGSMGEVGGAAGAGFGFGSANESSVSNFSFSR
ncbi:hypothetical protein DFJ73DRAFT_798905 [Zopfochytrium polystomum]|nr:hypothetical protein DFJ73DRAFT_798905 [Zopfochytrium polystomum]